MMLTEQWLLQRPLLKPRVDAADAAYEKLLDFAAEVHVALAHARFSRHPRQSAC